jgi:predicted nucleotidyltransferase
MQNDPKGRRILCHRSHHILRHTVRRVRPDLAYHPHIGAEQGGKLLDDLVGHDGGVAPQYVAAGCRVSDVILSNREANCLQSRQSVGPSLLHESTWMLSHACLACCPAARGSDTLERIAQPRKCVPTLAELRTRQDDILLVAAHEAATFCVFGSVARGAAGAHSDVDCLVDGWKTCRGFGFRRMVDGIRRGLGTVVGYPLDVTGIRGHSSLEGNAAPAQVERRTFAL